MASDGLTGCRRDNTRPGRDRAVVSVKEVLPPEMVLVEMGVQWIKSLVAWTTTLEPAGPDNRSLKTILGHAGTFRHKNSRHWSRW